MAAKYKIKGFSCNALLWDEAMKKAGPVALSKIIRYLIKLWLDDKIEIDWSKLD